MRMRFYYSILYILKKNGEILSKFFNIYPKIFMIKYSLIEFDLVHEMNFHDPDEAAKIS